jgi:WD40 repeat protein
MKYLKIIIPFLIFALVLSFLPACKAEDPEVTIEPTAEQTTAVETEVTEETVTEEIATVEEPEEKIAEGTPELVWSYKHENNLESVAVSPDGQTFVAGEYLTAYSHLLYDGEIIDVFAYRHSAEDLEFSPDGSILGAGLTLYGVVLTNISDGKILYELHDGYNNRLSFSPDGTHVATGNRDGIVWLWNVDDGKQVTVLENPEIEEKAAQHRWIIDINYHPSGKLISATHNDNTVYIWDLEKEQVTRKLQIDYKPFSFSPDGKVLAASLKEEGQYLVRLETVDGEEHLADIAVPGEIQDIKFSPDGSLLAVATFGRPTSSDSSSATTIWDVSSATLLYTLDQTFEDDVKERLIELSFTPDGGHLAVARWDGTLELWRLPGAEPIPEPEIDIKEPPPLPGDVLFDTGSSELKAGADEVLEEYASELYEAVKEASITFIGHTDSRGDAASNMQLSLDRATAVKDWFEAWIQDNGIEGWDFSVDGKGDTELKVPDVDAEGNFREEAGKLNRRVEIEIEA